MRRYFEAVQFDWFWLLWLAVLGLNLAQGAGCWVLVLFIFLLVRLSFLPKETMLLACCVLGLLWGRFGQVSQAYQEQASLPLAGVETTLILALDPLAVRETDFQLRGEGHVVNATGQVSPLIGEKIAFNLSKEEQSDAFIQDLRKQAAYWQVEGVLMKPDQAENFFTFDERLYFKGRDIAWELEVSTLSFAQMDTSLSGYLAQGRRRFLSPFIRYETYAWVALHNKLLLNLDSQAYRQFRNGLSDFGVLHLFALSGFHIHFLRQKIRYIFLRCGVTIETTNLVVEVLLACYCFLLRYPVGVIRSLAVKWSLRWIQKENLPLSRMDTTALVGLGLLFLKPAYASQLSFLLSFGLTMVIQLYYQKPKELSEGASAWKESFRFQLLCLLFTWPIFMRVNHEWNVQQFISVSLVTGLFNQLVMPVMLLTSIGLLLLPQGLEPMWAILSDGVTRIWTGLGEWAFFARTNFITGRISDLVLLLLLAAACYALYRLSRREELPYLHLGLVYLFCLGVMPLLDPRTTVTIIDVDQGDAMLVQPAFSREQWLIDTGGRGNWFGEAETSYDANFARYTLIPALKALGVHRLTGVILTHPDIDHIGNLPSLAEEVRIDRIYINDFTAEQAIWQEMLPSLSQTQIVQLPPGYVGLGQGNVIELLILDAPELLMGDDASNNSSIIQRIHIGPYQLLATGDLSQAGENRLQAQYPNLTTDFLKLGHHGSHTSTSEEYLAWLQPHFAYISAGEGNRYGHPHPEVLAKLEAQGIPYACTADYGAIQLQYSPLFGVKMNTAIEPENSY